MIFWAAYPAVATRFLPILCFGKRAQTGCSIRAAALELGGGLVFNQAFQNGIRKY